MTILEAINQVDLLKPNAYSWKQKVLWLSQLEAIVKRLVIDAHEGGDAIPFREFPEDIDPDTRLWMPSPFDMAYLYWLEAQIHYANEDIDLYNSAMAMFQGVFGAYKADYKRNHETRLVGRFRF